MSESSAPALPERYRIAVGRLDALIDAVGPSDRSPGAIRVRAERRLDRARRFLAYLGNPHDGYPIVHVGGTSGKGSTAAAIAGILDAAGYRVGLHTSPYLQVATEKLQLGRWLIAEAEFADLVDDVLAAAARWRAGPGVGERLTYGEIWMALLARWFAAERVDVAVVEVGSGGRFDVTNVVRPAVSVITSVGLDHTATLGPTVAAIAWHKAGIVKAGAPVVTAVTDPEALTIIAAEAAAVGTTVERVIGGETFDVLESGPDGVSWRERRQDGGVGPTLPTAVPGRFQALNAATALAAVRALGGSEFSVTVDAARIGLSTARLPGRSERMPTRSGPPVLLDGAHNPDKVRALVSGLPAILGMLADGGVVYVLGVLKGKDAWAILELVAPGAAGLVVTGAAVPGKQAMPPDRLAALAREAGYRGPVAIVPDPDQAIGRATEIATGNDAAIVVTGSLYLVGRVRRRWYPDEAIVRQRTAWPSWPTADDRG